MRPQDLPGYSHALSLFTCRIYRKRFRAVIGLCFVMQTHPRLRPYMRFLFVRPEICPLGDLLTPKIQLSSDSASRRTPLPLANPSHCRADSGLSPYRTCAHRAHIDSRQAPNEPAGLLILFICREIHPFAQRCFAFSIAFIQIQITIWVIKLTSLLPLLAECGFHNAKSSVAESATRCGVVCFLAVQDEILKEIFLIYCVCAFFIRVLGENLPVFIWKLFYFFLVPRVVGEGFAVGFCCRSPLHLSNSAQK